MFNVSPVLVAIVISFASSIAIADEGGQLQHWQIDERSAPGSPLRIYASTPDCDDCQVWLYTRGEDQSYYGRELMERSGINHTLLIPGSEMQGTSLHYYIVAKDDSGKIVDSSGQSDSPYIVTIDLPPPPAEVVPTITPTITKTRPKKRTSRCEVGPQLSYIHYDEPDVMSESGAMVGVMASCVHDQPTFLSIDGRYSIGWIDYDGMLMNGAEYKIDNSFNTLLEARGLIGRRFLTAGRSRWTGYTGVGYRRLTDDLSNDPAGYYRKSQYVYSPIGMRAVAKMGKDVLAVNAEYRYFWLGRQQSNFSDLRRTFPDIKNKQTQGYGLSLSFRLTTSVADRALELEPYARYWNIEQSEQALFGLLLMESRCLRMSPRTPPPKSE